MRDHPRQEPGAVIPPAGIRAGGGGQPPSLPRHTDHDPHRSRSVWATGFRPDYSWLDVPVVNEKGRLRHDGGVVDSPGLYALGLPMLRRRKSTFIHGIEDDAREVDDRLAAHLSGVRSPVANLG